MLGEALYEFVFGTIPNFLGVLVGFFTVALPILIGQAAGAIAIFLTQTIPQALDTAKTWVINTGSAIIAEVSTWPARFGAWINMLVTQVITAITKWGNDMKDKVASTGKSIIDEVSTWPGKIMTWLNTLPGLASKMMADLWNAFSGWLGRVSNLFEDWKNKAVSAWNAVTGAIQGAIDKAREAFNKGVASGGGLRFATGGVVPGPIGAPVMAMVHGGEEVLPTGRTGGGGGGGNITFEVNVGLYAGSETEKRNIARELYGALLQVATSQNKSVADFMGG